MFESTTISVIGSERATVGDGNKIVTFNGRTHVVWQDISREGYRNRIRTFDHGDAVWSEPVTLGQGLDNHARPIVTMDSEGFLHVVLGGHNSPVTWRRSTYPNDSSSWLAPEPIGEGTYPVIVCDSEDTLLLTLRANRHAGVDLYTMPKGEPWSLRSRIVKNATEYRDAYGAFHMQMMVGPAGSLHAAIDFYEGEDEAGRGFHMASCYCWSPDAGHSWQKADGTPIEIPASPEGMDVLGRSIESRVEQLPRMVDANCGILLDFQGRPTIVHLSHREAAGQLFLTTMGNDGKQHRQALHPALEELWPDMRVTEAKGTIDTDGMVYVLVTLSVHNEEWIRGKPSRAMGMVERNDQRLVLLRTSDRGLTSEIETVIEPGQSFNSPNIENAVGANRIEAGRVPTIMYFDGTSGYPGGGDYYDKPVEEYLEAGEFAENRVFVVMSF